MTLRWKLVVLYALIVAGVIGGFGAALSVGLRRSLVESMDGELEARARAVVALAEHEHDAWFIEEKAGLHVEFAESTGRYFVVAENGKPVLESALAKKLGVTVTAADGAADVERAGARYREVTVEVTKLADESPAERPATVRVVCGAPTAPVEASMAALTGQVLWIGPAALLVSLAGGFWLVSRALRPIDRMARTAREIEATDLSRRIDVEGDDELGRLAATLNDAFARLQDAFDRQTRFTADASHELRTPLAVIAGNIELALKRPRSADEYRDAIADIAEAAERMRSIVEGLLTLARADAKAVQLRRERVSLTTLADEVMRLHRPLAAERGVTVTVESDGDVAATGDPERLRELVSNLVSNAIRYNRDGGSVSVRLSRDGATARLAVDDTGIGIPAEDLPHVFERFYRADKSRTRGGTGLGLAIVKWIVDAHAGTVSVESVPGRTRFAITLPA